MCMLCVEIQKEYMKPVEVARAYIEIPYEEMAKDDHWVEVMREMYKHGYKLEEVSELMSEIRQNAKA